MNILAHRQACQTDHYTVKRGVSGVAAGLGGREKRVWYSQAHLPEYHISLMILDPRAKTTTPPLEKVQKATISRKRFRERGNDVVAWVEAGADWLGPMRLGRNRQRCRTLST